MKDQIQKKESANIQEKTEYTPEQIRKKTLRICTPKDDPENILPEFWQLFEKYKQSTGKEKKKAEEECNKLLPKVSAIHNLDNQILVTMAVSEGYRPYVIEFAKQIIKEHDCKTSSEKALAQVIAVAHVRILEYSKALNNFLNVKYVDHEQTNHYALLSKCLDRAQRDFLNALTTLKQIKSPSFNINIRTEQALIAQNQQVNFNQKEVNNEKVIS